MTPAELREWFATEYPTRNWDNTCGGVAYNTCRATGDAVKAYDTATSARLDSVIVSGESRVAPPGAAHFWDYWAWIDGVYDNYGHTAISFGAGAALMSNPEAWDDQWGIAMGVTNVPAWTARRAGVVTYRGWSYTYGQNTAQISTESATDHALERRKRVPDMYVRGTSNPDIYAVYTDANGSLRLRLASRAEAAYASAGGLVISGDDATLTMLGIEGQYRKPYSPTVDARIDFTPAQLRDIASYIKPGMTADEVKAAVAEGMTAMVGSVGFARK